MRDSATRARVVDAAVSAIVELGYYRASSNEITRRAGVSWGVIQHYFGTRERLLLAVFEHGERELAQLAETGTIDSPTLEGRLEQLLDILVRHYGAPSFLAYLQIQLNLGHDPDTSAEVRAIVDEMAVATISDVARLDPRHARSGMLRRSRAHDLHRVSRLRDQRAARPHPAPRRAARRSRRRGAASPPAHPLVGRLHRRPGGSSLVAVVPLG